MLLGRAHELFGALMVDIPPPKEKCSRARFPPPHQLLFEPVFFRKKNIYLYFFLNYSSISSRSDHFGALSVTSLPPLSMKHRMKASSLNAYTDTPHIEPII